MTDNSPAYPDTRPFEDFNAPLTGDSLLAMMVFGEEEDRKLKRELAKTNYLNIHQKRKKKR